MKHIHTRFLFIQHLVFRKLRTMSSVKTDVNPSDLFEINAWHGYWAERNEFTWQMVQWWRMTVEISGYGYGGLDESNDRHMWTCVDFWNFPHCNERRFSNLTQQRDARRRACWTCVMLLHSDILLFGSQRKQFWSLCTAQFAPVFRRLPHLQKRRFQYCFDAPGTFVYFRTLQGHSGRNPVDPSLQHNLIIQSGFFQHIY